MLTDQAVHCRCAGWKTSCYLSVIVTQYIKGTLYVTTKDLFFPP